MGDEPACFERDGTRASPCLPGRVGIDVRRYADGCPIRMALYRLLILNQCLAQSRSTTRARHLKPNQRTNLSRARGDEHTGGVKTSRDDQFLP